MSCHSARGRCYKMWRLLRKDLFTFMYDVTNFLRREDISVHAELWICHWQNNLIFLTTRTDFLDRSAGLVVMRCRWEGIKRMLGSDTGRLPIQTILLFKQICAWCMYPWLYGLRGKQASISVIFIAILITNKIPKSTFCQKSLISFSLYLSGLDMLVGC